MSNLSESIRSISLFAFAGDLVCSTQPAALGKHGNPPQVLEPSDVEEAVVTKGQVARMLVARRNEAYRRDDVWLWLSIHSVLGTCSFGFMPPLIRTELSPLGRQDDDAALRACPDVSIRIHLHPVVRAWVYAGGIQ